MQIRITNKQIAILIIFFIILTFIFVSFDIIILRQFFGFIFLAIIPGLLILLSLKIYKISFMESLLLVVGCSVSFLLLFGLVFNQSMIYLGYNEPFRYLSLLLFLSFLYFFIIIYKFNYNYDLHEFSIDFTMSKQERFLLAFLVLLPCFSVYGVYLMNLSDNNHIILLYILLLCIIICLISIARDESIQRLYPISIYLISVSLLLLSALRFNHIYGFDIYLEYKIYLNTIENWHWGLYEKSVLNSCISISILPTIYYSIIQINPEMLFKLLFSIIYSISPLAIYYISKRYINNKSAFLASCFYMFTYNFSLTELHARTNIALLFVSLIIYIIYNDTISLIIKKLLLIVFIISCILSHYSTSYMLFFVLLIVFIIVQLISREHNFHGNISIILLIISFTIIFVWYSQVTEVPFNYGISFIAKTIAQFNEFFLEESRSDSISCIMGKNLAAKGLSNWIEFFLTWILMGLSAIGVLIAAISHLSKRRFDLEYLLFGILSLVMLSIYVVFPYVSNGYGIDRVYSFSSITLSTFFIIGCLYPLKTIFTTISQKTSIVIICALLILYLLCILGVLSYFTGISKGILLNSDGADHDLFRVYDQEIYSSSWLSYFGKLDDNAIFADTLGKNICMCFSNISSKNIFILDYNNCDYLYLRKVNIDNGEFCLNFSRNNIYNNGNSKILF